MSVCLPLEIWQTIIGFCDDESLKTIDKHLPHLIDAKHPSWKSECWRLRHVYRIPEEWFNQEFARKVNFVKILLHHPFTKNLISEAKMFNENIITACIYHNSKLVSYQSHDQSFDGIINYRFPIAELELSTELLNGSFRLSFDYTISTRLDRYICIEMKTVVKSIDDGYFYGDEIEHDFDLKKSLHQLKPPCYRAFSMEYSSTAFAKNPVEDQELSIRLQVPYGLSITNIRLSWISSLGTSNIAKQCQIS
ncbi:hypothetical protein PRIPAC_76050 [Pristionchus pacificus]|uniref:Uncharacterized protein n=1 Tax=Pristionchus pacificus TaxID=54126 RepID=A0A2A6CRG2_PRIPA|nr:hypothetical protein PRIPAC_76050 [Pristionchus pacificus]|eukprot:PDM80686.1 hypothetical protein PRIPAC_35689 [Pristionchus pacificus]